MRHYELFMCEYVLKYVQCTCSNLSGYIQVLNEEFMQYMRQRNNSNSFAIHAYNIKTTLFQFSTNKSDDIYVPN